jgi:regulator of replication initiation timing
MEEQNNEPTFNLKDQISKLLDAKKAFAISAIDELVREIKYEYDSILGQRETELRHLKGLEVEYAKEIKHLTSRKNEILSSLEIETQSHKKTISHLIQKDKEIGDLIRQNEELLNTVRHLNTKADALSDEIGKRSLSILELNEEAQALRVENSELKDRADRAKSYAEKGSSVYANAQKIVEKELITRTLAKAAYAPEDIITSEKDDNKEKNEEAVNVLE